MAATVSARPRGGASMRVTNLVAGAVLGIGSAVALFWLIPNYTVPAQSALDLAPSFMPSVAMWVCLLLAGLLIKSGLPFGRHDQIHSDEEFGDEATGLGIRTLANFGLWVATSVVVMVLLQTLGFIVAGVSFLVAAMLYTRLQNYWLLALIAVGMPVALYWIVWFAFTIELP